jgi:hypothetical protein
LQADSCASSVACTAVGSSLDFNNGIAHTLAEVWNGTRWAVTSTRNPTGATSSDLAGVACPTVSVCQAVGSFYLSSGTQLPLAESWDGQRWLLRSTPNPAGATSSELAGVACPTASACVAVGSYSTSTGADSTFAETWNGSRWAVQATPDPTGAVASDFFGVSCPTSTECIAVGSYTGLGEIREPLAEIWNGTTWAVQQILSSSASHDNQLLGVSCATVSSCIAVGSFANQVNIVSALTEAWNGTSWTIESAPGASGALSGQFAGVSCPSTGACTAVGSYLLSHSQQETWAEFWNGSAWIQETTPTPTGVGNAELAGVSCPTSTECLAVGSSSAGPIAEGYAA